MHSMRDGAVTLSQRDAYAPSMHSADGYRLGGPAGDTYDLQAQVDRLRVTNAQLEKEGVAMLARIDQLEAQSQAHWELLRRVYDLIFVFDLQGIIVFATPSSREVLGYKPDELFNRPLADILAPESHREFEARVQAQLALQQQRQLTESELLCVDTFIRRDGSRVALEGRGQAWQRGPIVEFVISYRGRPGGRPIPPGAASSASLLAALHAMLNPTEAAPAATNSAGAQAAQAERRETLPAVHQDPQTRAAGGSQRSVAGISVQLQDLTTSAPAGSRSLPGFNPPAAPATGPATVTSTPSWQPLMSAAQIYALASQQHQWQAPHTATVPLAGQKRSLATVVADGGAIPAGSAVSAPSQVAGQLAEATSGSASTVQSVPTHTSTTPHTNTSDVGQRLGDSIPTPTEAKAQLPSGSRSPTAAGAHGTGGSMAASSGSKLLHSRADTASDAGTPDGSAPNGAMPQIATAPLTTSTPALTTTSLKPLVANAASSNITPSTEVASVGANVVTGDSTSQLVSPPSSNTTLAGASEGHIASKTVASGAAVSDTGTALSTSSANSS